MYRLPVVVYPLGGNLPRGWGTLVLQKPSQYWRPGVIYPPWVTYPMPIHSAIWGNLPTGG